MSFLLYGLGAAFVFIAIAIICYIIYLLDESRSALTMVVTLVIVIIASVFSFAGGAWASEQNMINQCEKAGGQYIFDRCYGYTVNKIDGK